MQSRPHRHSPSSCSRSTGSMRTTERSIAAQTRHRSMATLRRYIRLATAFDDNAVDRVGL
jgi:hypothetical protein